MAKNIIMLLGVIFVLVGLAGFFMDSPLFGLFEVDTTHNVVHLLSGVIAIAMAMKGEGSAKTYGKIFGLVYLLVTVLGFVMGEGKLLGLMEINSNDNYLHLLLAAVLLWAGFSPSRSNVPMNPTMGM